MYAVNRFFSCNSSELLHKPALQDLVQLYWRPMVDFTTEGETKFRFTGKRMEVVAAGERSGFSGSAVGNKIIEHGLLLRGQFSELQTETLDMHAAE